MPEPLLGTASAAQAIARVRYTHDAMIELILSRPAVHQNELARHFGMSVGWVSRVINSDAFQARLAARKDDVVDPMLIATFEDRIKGLANTSLDIIQEKLDTSRNGDLAFKTLELTTKALGMGARDRGGQTVNNTFVVALPEKATDQTTWAQQARQAANAAHPAVDAAVKEISRG